MIVCPVTAGNFCLPNGLIILAFDTNWYGQPLQTLRCFYLIAIPPIPPRELHVVIQDEFIDGSDQIKISLPWNIV
jgi:hypothetical protein